MANGEEKQNLQELIEQKQKSLELSKAELDMAKKYIDAVKAQKRAQEELNSLDQDNEENKLRIEALNKKIAAEERKIVNIKSEGLDVDGDVYEEKLRAYEIAQDELELQKNRLNVFEEQKKVLKSQLLTTLNLKDLNNEGFIASLEDAKNKGALGDAMRGYTEAVTESLGPSNLLLNAMDKTIQYTIDVAMLQDEARAGFAAATGAGYEYAETIRRVNVQNRMYGIDAQDAGEATAALYANMAGFGAATQEVQDELVKTTGLLNELGVANEVTAQNYQHMTVAMNMTNEAAIAQIKSFSELAGEGKTLAQVSQDFSESQGHLARYSGPQAMRVFEGLTKKSKALGMSMSSLTGIAENFETFEDAVGAGASINALLGGNFVDPMELLYADADEKIDIIMDLRDEAGLMWDTMSKFERISMAKALGMEEQDLQKLWSNSREELMAMNEEQKRLEELAAAAQPTMKKLDEIMKTFAITMGPVVDWVSEAITALHEFENTTRGMIPGVDAGVVSIAGMAFAGAKLISILGGGLLGGAVKTAGSALLGLGTKAKVAGVGMKLGGSMAGTGAIGLMIFAVKAAAIGGAVAIAALGLSHLVDSFSNLIQTLNVDAVAALGSFITKLSLATPMMYLAAPAVIALSASVLALGSAINFINLDKLKAVSSIMDNIASAGEDAENVTIVMREVRKVVSDIKDVDTENNIIKEIMHLVKMVMEGNTKTADAGMNNSGVMSVVLELDGRILQEYVIDTINKKASPKKRY